MNKKAFPPIWGPILLILVYVGLLIFIHGRFPNTHDLITTTTELYGKYGYYLIFFGALLEGMFLVSMYVPGSMVILIGAAVSRSGVIPFPLVYLLGTLGLTLGYSINYFLGKYGWYHMLESFGLAQGLQKAEKTLRNNPQKAILLGYFSPGTASFLSTAAGVLRMPFPQFITLSIIAQALWGLFWGSLAYFLGATFIEILLKYFGVVVLLLVGISLTRKSIRQQIFSQD